MAKEMAGLGRCRRDQSGDSRKVRPLFFDGQFHCEGHVWPFLRIPGDLFCPRSFETDNRPW